MVLPDKRTEKATKKVPNPTPPHKIFDGIKTTVTNKSLQKNKNKNKNKSNNDDY
eukprot:SAG11_NODE_4753_length_1779_cov_17.628571_1_plen_54_part_00